MDGSEKMSDISREFGANELYRNIKHIPRNIIYRTRGGGVYQFYKEPYKNDYKRFIPVKSDGFTKIGTQYLNQSIESYLYTILGAQAKTRQSMYSI